MGVEFKEAEQNLIELIELYKTSITKKKRNEATTRLHLINKLLFECLGWDVGDCVCEEYQDSNFIDYSFRCPECLFILEAKKEGVYFELPTGEYKIRSEISYFLKHAPGVGEAIKQAVGYCQTKGAPYGAVCNGHQIIVFLGSRNDGHPPLEGKAIVFHSLETLKDNFLFAWNCLSKPGIMQRKLSSELLETITTPLPEKLAKTISDYPGFKRRNALQTDLQILSELFIDDLARLGEQHEEQEFLRECYCKSGAISQYATISRDILKARYSALFTDATAGPSMSPAMTKKGLNPELFAQSLSRRPILLIGDIGVGKTMFIKNLYQIEAEEVFSHALVLYIDFATTAALGKHLDDFIVDEIERQLLERYAIDIQARNFVRGVLHGEVKRFEQGLYSDMAPEIYEVKLVELLEKKTQDRAEYLSQCLRHIQKGHRKQVVIFLDNVDQRTDKFQEQVFLVGQMIAENWNVAVFISIRPETFYRSRLSGILDAYHPRAFTIAPPRVDEVVNLRLKYGISLQERGVGLGFSETVLVKTQNLHDYLEVLVYSFSHNRYLIEFLDNMCGGNIRVALEFVRAFIGSGHVDTEKILNKYHETGSYLVPLHELIRAVVYGDHEHYTPAASSIINIFDISSLDGREHFLAPILLAQLDRWGQNSKTSGMVPISEIYSYLQSLGFNPTQAKWCIDRLLQWKLIESPTKSTSDEIQQDPTHYRLTAIGGYYVKRLITRFNYIDPMVVDTPIIDPEARSELADVYSIADRLIRAQKFCSYLDSQWEGFANQPLAFDWNKARYSINRDIEYITGKIQIREDIIEEDNPNN